jgi:hypothetical protein
MQSLNPLLDSILSYVLLLALFGVFVSSVSNFYSRLASELFVHRNFPIGKENVFKGQLIADRETSYFIWYPDGKARSHWNKFRCVLAFPTINTQWLLNATIKPVDRDNGTAFAFTFRGRITHKTHSPFLRDRAMFIYYIEVLETISLARL